jgi:DNA-binding response OmpR family regulator
MISSTLLTRLFCFPKRRSKWRGSDASDETILYLEQDPSLRAAISLALGRMGYQVLEASTTEEGLAYARHCSFDLFLLNISLLDGWGIEFCRQARLLDPDTPVFFFSSPEIGSIHQIGEPAARYFLKNPGIQELQQNIVRLIGESRSARVIGKGNSTRLSKPLLANRTA